MGTEMASVFQNSSSLPKRKMANEWERLSTFLALLLNFSDLKPLKLAKDGLFYNSYKNTVNCFSCEQETVVDSDFQLKCMDDSLHEETCVMKDYSRSGRLRNVSENLPILHPDDELSKKINTELHNKYCNSVRSHQRLTTLENGYDNVNPEQKHLPRSEFPVLISNFESENGSHRSPIFNGEPNKTDTASQTPKNSVSSKPGFRRLGEEYKDSKRDKNEFKPKVNKSYTEGKMDAPSISEELEEENRRLKDGKLCTICLDEVANILLLPCAHIPCCTFCSVPLKKCPICRQDIAGTVLTQYR